MKYLRKVATSAVAFALLTGSIACTPRSHGTTPGSDAGPPRRSVISASWAAEEVLSLDRQAQSADLIIRGAVVSIGTQKMDASRGEVGIPMIYRDVVIRVDEVLKGEAETGETVDVRVLGGTIQNTTVVVEGEPEFTESENVFLLLTSTPDFVVPREDGFEYSVVYGLHGKYRVEGSMGSRGERLPVDQREVSLDALRTAARRWQ